MRYATTSARSAVLHKQDNGITVGYCKRLALHVVDPETAAKGLSTGALRVCKNCDRTHGDRRRAELSLADQPLLTPPAAPARKRPAAVEPTLFDTPTAPTPAAVAQAPAKPRRRLARPAALSVATNAFEQAVLGVHEPRPGRYALQVCDETLDVCDRGACTLHSTRAAGTLDEVRAASALYRHAWAVSPSGERIPLTEQPVPAAAEQAPVENLPDGPMRVRMRMGISREDLDRIKAKADADRATFEAESTARRAAERAKYGPKPAQQAPVEGTVVVHRGEAHGEARGSLPKYADHPDVRAALDVLTGHGKRQTLRLATLRGDDVEDNPHAAGVVVEPRGGGRVALYWYIDGQHRDDQGEPWRVSLEILRDRMAAGGWLVEAGTVYAVMAWQPDEQPAVEAPDEIEQAPRCRDCSGRGCHWCYWTGENQLS
ncbi:hypothetical protein [Streptomyces sp. MJM8645]|uniref:hypothetical protein n=1 Tax=Streptomycetaceae TaxID=2062 RepID=UPI0007AF99FA|nr:hypothetical protein [Streptomyces sp. MJM8645]